MKRIKLLFAWYDFWIGVFVDTKKNNVYIFPLPMFGIVINYGNDSPKKALEWEQQMEDFRIGQHISRMAFERWSEWYPIKKDIDWLGESDKIFMINYAKEMTLYSIYDLETAKYKDVDISKLIDEEFEKLKMRG